MACVDCFKGSLHAGEAKGTIQDLYGLKTYVTLPPDNATPKSTIIFFCDAFGLNLINNKILADHYAAETGCRVLAPDFFQGNAATVSTMQAMNTALKPSETWAQALSPGVLLSKTWAWCQMLGAMIPFMIYNGAPKAWPMCLKYAQDVRANMPADGKMGAAGFCWGAYPATKLCLEPDPKDGSKCIIDAQFNAHPSFLKAPDDVVEAVEKFKVPYTIAVAEFDMAGFDRSAMEKTEAVLRQKVQGVGTWDLVLYKGCHHGFSVRASFDEGDVGKNGYEGAAKQAVDWFNKYLK